MELGIKNKPQKLQTSENRCLRAILDKKAYEITNQQLYEELNIEPFMRKIKNITRNFFQNKTTQHEITRNIGTFNSRNAPFRIKHKLINHILED